MYYVNEITEIEKTAGLNWFFWGMCPKGEKNLAIFLSSTRWGNQNEFPTKREALVNAFSMFIQLDLVRTEKWSQF